MANKNHGKDGRFSSGKSTSGIVGTGQGIGRDGSNIQTRYSGGQAHSSKKAAQGEIDSIRDSLKSRGFKSSNTKFKGDRQLSKWSGASGRTITVQVSHGKGNKVNISRTLTKGMKRHKDGGLTF